MGLGSASHSRCPARPWLVFFQRVFSAIGFFSLTRRSCGVGGGWVQIEGAKLISHEMRTSRWKRERRGVQVVSQGTPTFATKSGQYP